MARQPLPQSAMLRQPLGQRRIARNGALHPAPVHLVQFAIDHRDQHGFIDIRHAASPISSNNAPRPRTSRDVKVPIGMPSTAAASL